MECHPQAFFTPQQISSFVTHLSQRGGETIQLFFGPNHTAFTSSCYDSNDEQQDIILPRVFCAKDFPSRSILPTEAQLSSLRRMEEKREMMERTGSDVCLATAGSFPISFLDGSGNHLHFADNSRVNNSRRGAWDRGIANRSDSFESNDGRDADSSEQILIESEDDKETINCKKSPIESSWVEKSTGITRQSSTCRSDSHVATKSTCLKKPKQHSQAQSPSRTNSSPHPEENEWIPRRTKTNIGTDKKRFRSKQTPFNTMATTRAPKNTNVQSEYERGASRPSLKFMAAPGTANKRKRQMTLMNLVVKK
eukprot:CCRYP_012029-RA/>CCRYP_012029-RA protein AED:0.20 eAED:0.20 QI:0/-1/0/1/-1/1/1/0/308